MADEKPFSLLSPAIRRATALFSLVDEFGVTHIVTGDGNVEDQNLAFVATEMGNGGTAHERELIGLLKQMPVADRVIAWERFAYYDGQ